MSYDLFIAAILFSAASSAGLYLVLSSRRPRRGAGESLDMTSIETRLADLVSELNHVANTHAAAIEKRRDELKRVIGMANDKIQRLNMMLSDLEIVEGRIRAAEGETGETVVEEERPEEIRSLPQRHPERVARRRELYHEIRQRASTGESASDLADRFRMPANEVEMILKTMEKRH